MKNLLIILPLAFFVLSSCESGSRGGKKYIEVRGNINKTSTFGGCDFQTDCWDYTGTLFKSDFESAQLKSRCQNEGGQYVTNGCSDENVVASCLMNEKTESETVLHYYISSGLNAEDTEQLYTAQGGVLKANSPVKPVN